MGYYKHSYAMHLDCVAFVKHTCAMHCDCFAYDKQVVQCIGI